MLFPVRDQHTHMTTRKKGLHPLFSLVAHLFHQVINKIKCETENDASGWHLESQPVSRSLFYSLSKTNIRTMSWQRERRAYIHCLAWSHICFTKWPTWSNVGLKLMPRADTAALICLFKFYECTCCFYHRYLSFFSRKRGSIQVKLLNYPYQ